MLIQLHSAKLGLLDSKTRIPFRYGIACMTHCPQAALEVTAEVDGKRMHGYSGECLPPLWFDKTPGKSFEQQLSEMQLAIRLAAEFSIDVFRAPEIFFRGWLAVYEKMQQWAVQQQLPSLLASFGLSMVERAMMDAMLRARGISFHQGVLENIFAIQAGSIFFQKELLHAEPRSWLPAAPRQSIFVRHTVGLSDPLTRAEIAPQDDPNDNFPVALEEHLRDYGIDHLKIKVSNQLTRDVDRLRAIAMLVEKYRGNSYLITLDGNEQYNEGSQLEELIAAIENDPSLQTLWQNTLVIEQPLSRSIALDGQHTEVIRAVSSRKPVIIDESDGDLGAFAQAIPLGYRGVSSKSCKGVLKSLLNAALIWHHNQTGLQQPLVMTAEDLCTVGVVPVQADLCLVATLGLNHVERNGHHYHPGLNYLPDQERESALAFHGDLYERRAGRIAPRIVDGQFQIGSLQCPGFGFAALPEMSAREIAWEL